MKVADNANVGTDGNLVVNGAVVEIAKYMRIKIEDNLTSQGRDT